MNTLWWKIAAWLLLFAWAGCALLDMVHIRAGLLTSYGADVSLPAWLYIIARSLDDPLRTTSLKRHVGRSPERAAGIFFGASTLTEVSQYYWPTGVFRGTFDPFDVLAYASGIAICYIVDKYC